MGNDDWKRKRPMPAPVVLGAYSRGPPGLGGMRLEPRLSQQLVMTPPLAETLDDVVKNAELHAAQSQLPELPQSYLNLVKTYIASENLAKPYSDKQILEYAIKNGFNYSRLDVARARTELNIPPASKRYNQSN